MKEYKAGNKITLFQPVRGRKNGVLIEKKDYKWLVDIGIGRQIAVYERDFDLDQKKEYELYLNNK